MNRLVTPFCAASLALATLLAPVPAAEAGETSGAGVVSDHFTPETAARFSKDIERDLASRNARVAIVFRTGRPREHLPEGVAYTHGSFWVYQAIETPDGGRTRGYVSHNLFHGDGEETPRTRSYLETDFPFDFVSASAVDDVAVIVPTPEMQRRILALMSDGTYERLHVPGYSLISNPADARLQNCSEFLLDVVAAAAWETDDYAQIKANLSAHFQPQVIDAGPMARLFGPAADERLRMKDHGGGPIETVTYRSLVRFMMEHGLADEAYTLVPSPDAEPEGAD